MSADESKPLPLLLRQLGGIAKTFLKDAIREVLEEMPAPKVAPALLTANELCDAIGISRSKLDGLLVAGLPFVRVGSTRRFELDEVISHLRSLKEAA